MTKKQYYYELQRRAHWKAYKRYNTVVDKILNEGRSTPRRSRRYLSLQYQRSALAFALHRYRLNQELPF